MSAFTCNTCRVAFADADLQREHYRADWHRYNLKRKVAEMPPVTLDNFQQRVKAQTAQVYSPPQARVNTDAAEDAKDKSSYCALCGKHFNTQNAYTNHLASKKHKDVEAKHAQKKQAEIEKKNAKNEVGEQTVLEQNNKVSQKNLQNEAIKARLQSTSPVENQQPGARPKDVPTTPAALQEEAVMEVEDDSEEEWDGEALGEEECLFCSYVSNSLEDNIQHMTKVHSFFIPDIEFLADLNGLITYLGQKVGEGNVCLWCNEKGKQFHTTRSVQQHMVDKGHCKMLHDGDAVFEYADFYDYRSSYPDYEEHQEMEAAGGAPANEEEEEEEEEEVELELLEEQNYQLVLPSGSTIGHRSLQRYYRQKLKPTKYDRNPNAVSRVISQYRALGWTGTIGADAQKRAKDVAFVKRMRSRKDMRMGMKNNKIMQHHFRPQVIF